MTADAANLPTGAPGAPDDLEGTEEHDGPTISEAKARLAVGIAGVAGFAYYTWDAFQMPRGDAAMPGPGLFPQTVGVVGLAMACFVVFDAVMKMRDSGTINVPNRARAIQVWGIVLLLGLYVFTFDLLGAYLSSFLFTALSVRLLSGEGGVKGWLKCLLIGAAISLPIIFFFAEMLTVSLPDFGLF